jgi:biopolymer transport protein ExbD
MGAVDLGGSKKPAGGGMSWKRPRVNIRIDMTPMVDIAFLLLIFFMVTTVFRLPQAMEMNLPENKADTPPPESKIFEKKLLNVWVMRIGDRDSIAVAVGNDSPKPLAWDSVRAKLLERRAAMFNGTREEVMKMDALTDLFRKSESSKRDILKYEKDFGAPALFMKIDSVADANKLPRMSEPDKQKFFEDMKKIDQLVVLAKIDRKAKYLSLVDLVDEFNVSRTFRFSIDRYTTYDDSLMRLAGFTTGGPKDLPAPVFAPSEG